MDPTVRLLECRPFQDPTHKLPKGIPCRREVTLLVVRPVHLWREALALPQLIPMLPPYLESTARHRLMALLVLLVHKLLHRVLSMLLYKVCPVDGQSSCVR